MHPTRGRIALGGIAALAGLCTYCTLLTPLDGLSDGAFPSDGGPADVADSATDAPPRDAASADASGLGIRAPRLYVLGGVLDAGAGDARATDEVLSAPILDGGVLGSWQAEPPMPATRWLFGAVADQSALLAVGGTDAVGTALAQVAVTTRQPDGGLGAWQAAAGLPFPRYFHSVVAVGGVVYVVGGSDKTGQYQPDVLTATLGAAGLSLWSPGPPLPTATGIHGSAASRGLLWITGGVISVDGGTQLTDAVRSVPILDGGALGAWGDATPLAGALYQHAMVAHDADLYVIGGDRAINGPVSDVQIARIQSGGTLGAWKVATALPAPREQFAACISGDTIFVTGGLGVGGSVLGEVLSATVTGADGALSAWQAATPLPRPRLAHRCAVF